MRALTAVCNTVLGVALVLAVAALRLVIPVLVLAGIAGGALYLVQHL